MRKLLRGNGRTAASQPEQQHGQSEEWLRLIVEAWPSAIVIVNKLGSITFVNAQTEHLFSYAREDLLSKVVKMLIPSRFCARHLGYREHFFAHPSVRLRGVGRDLNGLRADGSEFPIKIGLNPMVTNEEHIVIASVIDITERKRSEQCLRLVIDAAPTAMVVVDSKGTIQLANATTDKLFGAIPSQLLGAGIKTLIPERFRAKHPDYRQGFFMDPVARPMGAMLPCSSAAVNPSTMIRSHAPGARSAS
jgi:PAS domain S-box-containing protein